MYTTKRPVYVRSWKRRRIDPLLIILACTNDLVQMADTSLDGARAILRSILELHQRALTCNNDKNEQDADGKKMHTLAIGIPRSYALDKSPELAKGAKYVNDAVKSYSSSAIGSGTAYHFDSPFP